MNRVSGLLKSSYILNINRNERLCNRLAISQEICKNSGLSHWHQTNHLYQGVTRSLMNPPRLKAALNPLKRQLNRPGTYRQAGVGGSIACDASSLSISLLTWPCSS